jgi:hypothetical protein
MTKKDYELIASGIAQIAEHYRASVDGKHALEHLTEHYALVLGADNPRFQPAKFRAACLTGAKTDTIK